MNELLEIIEKLDNQLDNLLSNLDAKTVKLQDDVFNKLMKLLSKLDLSSQGKIKTTLVNLKLVNQIKKELGSLIVNTQFAGLTDSIKDAINTSDKFINEYFSVLVANFGVGQVFKEIKNNAIKETLSLLRVAGLDANFIVPTLNIIRNNITIGGSFEALRADLYDYISASNNLQRYVKQIANDAIMTYERTYMHAISQDLELEHYFYQGTKIKTSRQFCQTKVGKAFTKKQVEGWVSVDWQGRARGTNKENIFFYVGGYNCRHRLIPISKEIYDTL